MDEAETVTDDEAADALKARGWEHSEDGWTVPGFHMAPMTQLEAAKFEIFLTEATA